jgi:hypothetical protein
MTGLSGSELNCLHKLSQPPFQSSYLATFPSELLLKIICSLPSLVSELPFLSTCHRFRAILHEHAGLIHRELNLDPCTSHAFVLVAGQQGEAGTTSNGVLTPQKVLSLSRCFQRAQKALKMFEERIVCRMKGE